MKKTICARLARVSAVALLAGLGAAGQADAGSFGIREQSTYFQGSGFAGSAAGGDISSMFWNSAATASLPGFNVEASGTLVLGSADMTATAYAFSTLAPTADIGTDAFVPAMYGTYQLNDRLYAGIAVNSPFGLTTKPDNTWAGSPIATTSRIRSLDFNPTIAYKITPELTVGVGVQAEYFKITLNSLAPRNYEASGWGAGATAGVLWQPAPFTSLGLGYRSAVSHDLEGVYRGATGIAETSASVTLPDELTLSARQAVTDRLALLGTVEWQTWSRIGNVSAAGGGCLLPGGACETLNLNYRDGWYFALGAEYAYSPSLLLRTGVSYEISPIEDETRSILIPDSDRLGVSVGGSYRYSDRITFDFAYTHLFFDDAPYCMAPQEGTGTTHCVPSSIYTAISGSADVSVDLLSVGAKYSTGAPVAALEPYKR